MGRGVLKNRTVPPIDVILIPMHARLRHLLEPARTSPTDAFTWNDKRPKSKQLANGFRIAGGLIAGFVVMVMAMGGLAQLSSDHPTSGGGLILASWAALVAAVIMFWTANRWAGFVTGFFFGPALLKILGVLVVGDDSYYSSHSITRTDVAELLAYVLAVVALTSRFVGKRPAMTTVVDRLALTFFVFTSLKQVISPYHFPPWPLLSGLIALLLAWCTHRFTHVKRTRGHTNDTEAPVTCVGT
jgi:hypothetical protein